MTLEDAFRLAMKRGYSLHVDQTSAHCGFGISVWLFAQKKIRDDGKTYISHHTTDLSEAVEWTMSYLRNAPDGLCDFPEC